MDALLFVVIFQLIFTQSAYHISFNPFAMGAFAQILPVRLAVISTVGEKKKKKKKYQNVSVQNRQASFLLNYFHFLP